MKVAPPHLYTPHSPPKPATSPKCPSLQDHLSSRSPSRRPTAPPAAVQTPLYAHDGSMRGGISDQDSVAGGGSTARGGVSAFSRSDSGSATTDTILQSRALDSPFRNQAARGIDTLDRRPIQLSCVVLSSNAWSRRVKRAADIDHRRSRAMSAADQSKLSSTTNSILHKSIPSSPPPNAGTCVAGSTLAK